MPDVIREDMVFLDRIHYYLPGWELEKVRRDYFTDHYGFVVDYFAEALRELRKQNHADAIYHHFSMGTQLKQREVKAVQRTVSGLIKLVYPHGDFSKEELAELLDIAMEGRRRVKEQLKKLGSFEFHQTSFSYIDNDTREEFFVGVPEEGGRNLIATDPLPAGSIYTASVDSFRRVGLYRIEVSVSPGSGKLKLAGGAQGGMKESVNRAFGYLLAHKGEMGIASAFDTADLHVEVMDLFSNQVPAEIRVALIPVVTSALKKHQMLSGLLVLSDPSVRRNLKPLPTLAETLQVAMDNGARRALIPIENVRILLDVSGEIRERVDHVFYGEVMTATLKGLWLI